MKALLFLPARVRVDFFGEDMDFSVVSHTLRKLQPRPVLHSLALLYILVDERSCRRARGVVTALANGPFLY